MTAFGSHQLLYETDTWKRLLEFIQAENVFLKNRLALITKQDSSDRLLEAIEHYQNMFILEDNTIGMLRHDVSEQEKWIKKELEADGFPGNEAEKKHKRLRKEIEIAEQKFNNLKFEFNRFFSEKLSG